MTAAAVCRTVATHAADGLASWLYALLRWLEGKVTAWFCGPLDAVGADL